MLENLKQNVVPHNCCWKRRVYITHWGSTEHKNALRSSPSLWIIKVLGRENYNKLEWNYSFTVTGQDDILILGVFCAATNIWCSARVPLSLLQSWERCLSSPLSGLQLMLIAWIHFQPRYVWDDKADNCSDHTTDHDKVDSLPSVTVPLGQDFTFRSVSPSSSLPASSNLFPPGIRLITGFLTLHGFVPLLLHLSLSLFNDWEFYFFVNYSLPLHSMKYIYFNKEFGNSGRETHF